LDIVKLVNAIDFHDSLVSHLEIFQLPEWKKKLKLNQSSLFCMAAVGRELGWNDDQMKDLVTLGFIKDIGYSRLEENMDNFETLHPLVSHKLIEECNEIGNPDQKITKLVADAVLLHHEFTDGSGPLARMRHPLVTGLLDKNQMPHIAQVSGICDLYFGFLKDYSPGLAFSISCGFVLGQGDVPPRYSPDVVKGFINVLKQGSYGSLEIPPKEAQDLIHAILGSLKDQKVRQSAAGMVNTKSESWYERITLALNIVRNIAQRQPEQMGEESLVNVLHLPIEFGLNY